MQLKLLTTLLFILIIGTCLAEEVIYPTTIGDLTAQVKLKGSGTITGLNTGEEVRFQTLTFQETEFQKLSDVKEELYINGKTITPKYVLDEFGNKSVVFSIPENGTFIYELGAEVSVRSTIFELSDYQIGKTAKEVEQFLDRTQKVESNSTEIKTLEINKLTDNSFLNSLNQTILWTNGYVEYPPADSAEFSKYYLTQKSAVDTLLAKKGVCDEFANLSAAILRAKGVPTRMAIGITFDGRQWGNHAWIEVYHAKYGWIPSDPTFREPGFVDATHIKMGSYSDVTESLAKAIYPSTANVILDTQSQLPEVIILDKQYFADVDLVAEPTELKTQQWNEIKLSVKNKTSGTILVPIKIKSNSSQNELAEVACLKTEAGRECLLVEEPKKSILLKPNETKIVSFRLYPNISLSSQYKIDTNLVFYSLDEPYTTSVQILAGTNKKDGEILIKDITPIATDNKMKILIHAVNASAEEKTMQLIIRNGIELVNTTETLQGFEAKDYQEEITDTNTNEYNLSITTQNSVYTQTILTEKDDSPVQKPTEIKQTVIEQKIDPKQEGPNLVGTLVQTPIILFGGLLVIVGILLFAILMVNKKYI